VTGTGTAYSFTVVDPSLYQQNIFFNAYFPFLDNDPGLALPTVQTSAWFSSSNSLLYNMNMSDNTQAPTCFLFDQITGEFIIDPTYSEQSQLVNLKFSVSDKYQGWAQLYKQVLINSSPKATKLYTIIRTGVRNRFSFDLSVLFKDYDGDQLTLSLPNSADETELSNHGISFQDVTKTLWGKPIVAGTVSLITVEATDPHGYSAKAYITIII
jgi:hypothetical protein